MIGIEVNKTRAVCRNCMYTMGLLDHPLPSDVANTMRCPKCGSNLFEYSVVQDVVQMSVDDRKPVDLENSPGAQSPPQAPLEDPVEEFPGGFQRPSHLDGSTLPPKAIVAVMECMTRGAHTHGRDKWKNIPVWSHLGRALAHIFQHNAGDRSEPHILHAACRLLFALDLQELENAAIPGFSEPPFSPKGEEAS